MVSQDIRHGIHIFLDGYSFVEACTKNGSNFMKLLTHLTTKGSCFSVIYMRALLKRYGIYFKLMKTCYR